MSDEERDLRKYSRRSAIGLMGVGGGLAATETLGFTNLTADRGVNVDVANDLNAVLIIAVDEGGNGDFDEELTEDPFTGDSNVEFVNQSDTGIEGDDFDGLTVEVDATDSADGTELDISNLENFNVTGSNAVNDVVTAETDLGPDSGGDDRAVLKFSPSDDGGGNSPAADITVTATFSDGTTLELTREDITFAEESN